MFLTIQIYQYLGVFDTLLCLVLILLDCIVTKFTIQPLKCLFSEINLIGMVVFILFINLSL